jgi:YD repeat-containing protein
MLRGNHVALLLSLFQFAFVASTYGSQFDSTPITAARVAYFAHMPFRETPFADLRGVYPITEEQSRKHKHYRFVYDAQGRPVEVSFRLGDDIQNLNISRNALTFSPVIRVKYEYRMEIRTFFDRFMNPTLANSVFRELYEVDDDGNRTSLRFYDVEDAQIESGWGIYAYEWSVDKRGTVTETRSDEDGESVSIRPHFPFYCLKLHYDQRGLLALMENYGMTCEGLSLNNMNAAMDKLQYNASGGIYAWNVYDAQENRAVGNAPRVARGIMERDDLGHTTREYYEDEDGEIMTSAYGWTNTYASFDEFGNMVARFNHDANGKRTNNSLLGYSGYIATYDENGEHRTSLSYQNADGSPATHLTRGFHSAKTETAENGNRRWSRFEDSAGNPVLHKIYCAATIEYSYDDRNRRISMRLFDEKDEPARHCDAGWHEKTYHYHPKGPLSHTEEKIGISSLKTM